MSGSPEDNVRPIRKPHRLRLNCCIDCEAQINAQWDLAMESRYADAQVAVDEHEPRMDTRFDRDDEIEDSRGLW